MSAVSHRRSAKLGTAFTALLVGLFLIVLPTSSAFAGRFLGTGHDADYHCSGSSQCHFVEVATNYVRGGAPDPSKPVLVLDNQDEDFPQALDNAFGVGVVPRVVMDPSSATFASAPLDTSTYSAILVASDDSCGGCDLNEPNPGENTADSDAINARAGDIANFFNAGGGLYFNAGADHANGDPSDGADVYYNSVPLGPTGVQVTSPFTLTPEGQALGFEDSDNSIGTHDDINCCATHNSFAEPPAGSPLKVSERDAENFPETLFAEGFIVGGTIVSSLPTTPSTPAPTPAPVKAQAKPTAKAAIHAGQNGCVKSTASARVSGKNISRVVYSLDGRKIKTAKGNKSSVKVNARHLKSGVHRITARITFTKATAAKAQTKRVSFVRCARKAVKPKFTG